MQSSPGDYFAFDMKPHTPLTGKPTIALSKVKSIINGDGQDTTTSYDPLKTVRYAEAGAQFSEPINVSALLNDISNKNSNILLLEHQLDAMMKDKADLEEKIESLELKLKTSSLESSKELTKLNEHIQKTEDALLSTYDKNKRLEQAIKGLESSLSKSKQEEKILTSEKEILLSQLDILRKTNDTKRLECDLKAAEEYISGLHSRINDLEEQLKSRNEDIESYRTLISLKPEFPEFQEQVDLMPEITGISLAAELGQESDSTRIKQLEDENRALLVYIRNILGKIMEAEDSNVKNVLMNSNYSKTS